MSNVSDPTRKSALKKAIIEASNTLLQIDTHKEHLKSIVDHIAEDYEMDKSIIRGLINMYHKQNSTEIKAKSETLLEEYERIFE